MYLLYNIILIFAALFLIPIYLLRGVRYGKTRRGIRERIGLFDPEKLAVLAGRQVIWVHAVSVGETRAAIPLIRALRKTWPDAAIVLSNVTETGHAIAATVKEVDVRIFFPFDLSWVVGRVLRRIAPQLVVIVETEIWPNFVRHAKRQSIPLVLVNGRISDRSFPRYLRVRGIFSQLLSYFDAFCMQSQQDADRIKTLGAAPQKVQVTHNLKFDMQVDTALANTDGLRPHFGLPQTATVWVAGSTHAGEEELVVTAYKAVQKLCPELVLVLVPRHPERAPTVADMLARQGLAYRLRSQLRPDTAAQPPGSVLLVDTLGEMLSLYAAADIVFVGGSFIPVGGHNILEASLLKKPVLFGPYMHNFKEISRLVLQSGGGWQVETSAELERQLTALCHDKALCAAAGAAGYALIARNAGATAETVAVLQRIVGGDVPTASRLRAILAGEDRSLPARLLIALLLPASWLFGLLAQLRGWMFAHGLRAVYASGLLVVSVGNLTAGGTGKTPAVDYLVRALRRRGRHVAIVSRGYGAASLPAALVSDGANLLLDAVAAGDEPLLLAQRNPGVPVVVSRRRADGLRLLQQVQPLVDCVVLDDAFQHRQVHRDLDIVLLDAARPFGNGRMQPAGLLREPPSALSRADLVILTRAGDDLPSPMLSLPALRCRHVLAQGGRSLQGASIELSQLAGRRVFAFAGIAEPEAFFAALRAAGVALSGSLGLTDHAIYDEHCLQALNAAAADAQIFLTTEKDAVKLSPASFDRPCYAVGVSLEFEDDTLLQQRLDRLCRMEK